MGCHGGVFEAFHSASLNGVADWKIALFRLQFDSGKQVGADDDRDRRPVEHGKVRRHTENELATGRPRRSSPR